MWHVHKEQHNYAQMCLATMRKTRMNVFWWHGKWDEKNNGAKMRWQYLSGIFLAIDHPSINPFWITVDRGQCFSCGSGAVIAKKWCEGRMNGGKWVSNKMRSTVAAATTTIFAESHLFPAWSTMAAWKQCDCEGQLFILSPCHTSYVYETPPANTFATYWKRLRRSSPDISIEPHEFVCRVSRLLRNL